MKDRIPKYPGRVKLVPVPGQANTYDMVRVDEPEEEGTPLNSNTFLKTNTAQLFGLGESAVPDDVFTQLHSDLYSSRVIEKGTEQVNNGAVTWNYIKTADGYYEAWFSYLEFPYEGFTINVDTNLGGIYKSSGIDVELPSFSQGTVAISCVGSCHMEFSGTWAYQYRDEAVTVVYWAPSARIGERIRLSLWVRGRTK